MKARIFILAVLLIVLSVSVSGCDAAATPMPPTPHPGLALVSSRCSTCHPLGLVENSKFSEEGWTIVVDRMVMAGTPLNDEQAKLVVDYLAISYPKE
jgi:hypothetical protein